MINDRRFIEESFPVKEVGIESAREKKIRHGHISTLHIWWSRKPLASSRATNYAALIPTPENVDEWNKTREFIINFSKWENSLDQSMIQKAREDILKAYGGKTTKVLDPFGGGGAIPLEALRLGCETYSNDLNPVAVLIQKCTLEYPQKYGRGSGLGIGGSGFETKGEKKNEELQRARSVAEGDKSGNRNIQSNQSVSAGGTILPNISETEGGGIGSSEHSGGMGQGFNEGIHPVSPDSKGFTYGIGDASHHSPETQLFKSKYFGSATKGNRSRRNDAESFDPESEATLRLFPNYKFPNPLLSDVEKWGNWVLEEAKKEIGKFYTEEPDGSIPVGYIWARTIPCQHPSCVDRDGQPTQIPLMRQFWLAKKDNKKVALFPYVERVGQSSRLSFKIVGDGYEKTPDGFDPENGTISRAVATCPVPVCGSTVDAKTTRKLFQEGNANQRMVAVVLHHPKRQGKTYRIAAESDMDMFGDAEKYLEKKRQELFDKWGIDPVPDEEAPGTFGSNAMGDRYCFHYYGDYFNSRQKLALITFVDKVKKVHRQLKDEGFEEEYAKAVVSYLACAISRLIDQSTVLAQVRQLKVVTLLISYGYSFYIGFFDTTSLSFN